MEFLFSEVTLSSLSSVLSYNQFDFGPIFKHGEKFMKEKRGEKHHQPSFMKQMIYFILFTILNLGYVSSFPLMLFISEHFKAYNLHGDHHDVNGQHQDGGHQWEPPQPHQAPGKIK